jgi:hypothetical protein
MTRVLYPHERTAIAKQIKDAVNEYCAVTYDDGHRTHLGASLIGHECRRYLWYVWRWVKQADFINDKGENHKGRMQRLFNRGHREEERFIEWLRGIGFTIWDIDPETGNQIRVSGVEKHYGGSLDSVGKAPAWLHLLAEVGPFLVEYKTHNAKSFAKLVKDGVKVTKPQHWAQMCTYGSYYKFKYALYCAINKDDDDIDFQIVELDWALGMEKYRLAEEVIQAVRPPPRLSELPSYFKCKTCDFRGICHKSEQYEKNCRSCAFATPVKDGQWFCGVNNDVIPKDFIPKGCGQWKPVGRNG